MTIVLRFYSVLARACWNWTSPQSVHNFLWTCQINYLVLLQSSLEIIMNSPNGADFHNNLITFVLRLHRQTHKIRNDCILWLLPLQLLFILFLHCTILPSRTATITSLYYLIMSILNECRIVSCLGIWHGKRWFAKESRNKQDYGYLRLFQLSNDMFRSWGCLALAAWTVAGSSHYREIPWFVSELFAE